MATFSPSPPPRRTLRSDTAGRFANSPAVASRRTKLVSGRPASRFSTPSRPGARQTHGRDEGSVASEMDVDEKDFGSVDRAKVDTVFAKSEELSVTFYASLPAEVKQILGNADIYGDYYSGDIDTLTGFALVVSQTTCFVWQHAQALKGTPTCYIFACPLENACPFHCLVPYGQSREPGLILLSPRGELRFWDSIGIGLAGGEHFTTTILELSDGEYITNLLRSDPQTYIVSTSIGSLYRLVLTSAGGRRRLTPRVFSRPQSRSLSLTRLLPSLWYSTPASLQPEVGNVSAIAFGETNVLGKDVWALVDSRLQKWNMSVDGWEEIVLEEDLADMIRLGIQQTSPSASSDISTLDLELLDLALENPTIINILVSYAGTEDLNAMDFGSHPRRLYALVRISNLSDTFKVEKVSGIPYQSTSSSGAPVHPRMQLISGGAMVSIQFGDAVVLCARDSLYQDRLGLKSITDRTLGVGVVENENALLILTTATMMKARVSLEAITSFDAETGRANLIKSIMTQAILYGSIPENPLHFSFPPDIDESSLMLAAEQLSQAILQSDTEVVKPNHDLSSQLWARMERLNWLIRFISDNGVLSKMSQRSRQKLATNAEKLHACYQLWVRHNEYIDGGATYSVLTDAIQAYMNSIGESDHEDIVRAFFKYKVTNIAKLLPNIMEAIHRSAQDLGRSLSVLLPEANTYVLTIWKSASDYRKYNLGLYGIELPMIQPWTSRPAVIDIVLGLFDATTRLVESPASGSDIIKLLDGPSQQLPDLAAVLFSCIQERLDWLGSAVAADDANSARDRDELDERFRQLRPEVLETLRLNKHSGPAFELAESFRDFRSLASLCNKGTTYPPQENPNAQRIQTYIDKFKEDFTTELYNWYIEHGELRAMFTQDEMYSGYMDRFFAQNAKRSISWIHDFDRRRYGDASVSLLEESKHASNLEIKHFMLSVGHLAQLARLQEAEASVDEAVLDALHDELDFVSVQEKLLQEMKSALAPATGRQTIDNQIEAIAKVKATALQRRKVLLSVFKNLAKQLLQGRTLSSEDLVDVLTLKDNANTTEDYATALQVLLRAEDAPDARRLSAFRRVWCRIFLHDDWDGIRRTANVTDSQLSTRFRGTALYSTLLSILSNPNTTPGYDLDPESALPIPSIAEISSRFPGMPPEQVEALIGEYQSESTELGQLQLEDVYHRVRDLAAHDAEYGQ